MLIQMKSPILIHTSFISHNRKRLMLLPNRNILKTTETSIAN